MIYEHSVDTVDAIPPIDDFTLACASKGAESCITLLMQPLYKNLSCVKIKQQGSYYFLFCFISAPQNLMYPRYPFSPEKAMQKVFSSVT